MNYRRDYDWSRREFLKRAGFAGTAAIYGLPRSVDAAEPAPETTRIRLVLQRGACTNAPQYVAQEFLRQEGFAEVQYVQGSGGLEDEKFLVTNAADFITVFAGRHILAVDAGDPIVVLAGLHTGCYELFGTDRIVSIHDLKRKRVAVTQLTSGRHILLSIMAANVGLDPQKDFNWVTDPADKSIQLFAEKKIDAFMAFPLEPQELRAKKIGHVIVNTTTDRPWSQYFCCMIAANREFVRKHPIATKRVLRSLLKATDICALEPEKATRTLMDKGYAKNHDYALEAIREIGYSKWRDYDPEDTMRYYALRLHEVGMIKSNPQKILALGTDWRFLKELKKELKG
jgi:NitT/TauT family transport system substrate-binding protein